MVLSVEKEKQEGTIYSIIDSEELLLVNGNPYNGGMLIWGGKF